MEVTNMGSIYGFKGGNYAGIVYAAWGIAPTIMTAQGGNRMPMTILAHKAGEANRYDVRHPKDNNQHRQSLER